jgi:hypothetical protein
MILSPAEDSTVKKDSYILSIDWLQISFHGSIPLKSNLTFKDLQHPTRVFKKWYAVFLYSIHIGDLFCNPASPIIHPLTMSFKADNSLLYNTSLKELIYNMLSDLTASNIKVKRLDLCCDFQCFNNNYWIENFTTDLIQKKIIYNSRSKFRICGTSNDVNIPTSLSWGSRTSFIYVTLYDKIKEMKEVKLKPYILKKWHENNFNIGLPSWRLEFSLNFNGEEFTDKNTGEIFDINFAQCFDYLYLKDLFIILLNKKFVFLKNQKKKNKSENQKINLFNTDLLTFGINRNTNFKDSTRSNRIHINHRIKYINEIEKINKYLIHSEKLSLYYYISTYNLMDYFIKINTDVHFFDEITISERNSFSHSEEELFNLPPAIFS